MPGKSIFADIHCHSSFKAYAKSFASGNSKPDPQPTDVTSLWYESEISRTDSILSKKLGVAMYTQSHLTAAALGGLQVIGLSMGALEKEFITVSRPLPEAIINIIKEATGGIADAQNILCNLVTRFGKDRLDKVRNTAAYFPDLMAEIAFTQSQEEKVFKLADGKHYTYRIAKNGAMIADILAKNAAADAGSGTDNPITICLVLSMEGLHNLDAHQGADEAAVLAHVQQLKDSEAPVPFVTFCHHFWNGLCGHSESLAGLMRAVFDQTLHERDGFAPIGVKVLMALLDSRRGRRILVDIKHMSYKGRKQYFNLMDGLMPDDLEMSPQLETEAKAFFRFNKNAAPGSPAAAPPVIISHTAVNGYADDTDKTYHGNYPAQSGDGVVNPFENREIFPDPAINSYDTDLLYVARFGGLVGVQMDVHRIAGPAGLQVASKRTHGDAWLVWNQVTHMVELWDRMGCSNAWDLVCIGSDFDGIISPLDGLHRASSYPDLREGLLYYARRYFMPKADFAAAQPGMSQRGIIANRFQVSARNPSGMRLNPAGPNAPEQTGHSPEQIVEKFCSGNVLAFMTKYFV